MGKNSEKEYMIKIKQKRATGFEPVTSRSAVDKKRLLVSAIQ